MICYGLNCVPQKIMLKSQTPVSENVTLLGNRVVADVMSQDEVILE